ncbi:MAG: RimK/LysX family protein [Pseudomonadota bacterium]
MGFSVSSFRRGLSAMAALAFVLPGTALAEDQIHILGWLEKAEIMSAGIRMDAKLDTGAKTSAIHAEILSRDDLSENELLELRAENDDDEEMVEPTEIVATEEADEPRTIVFRLTNEYGDERIVEREVVRTVRIKRRSGGVERRPVVELDVCIAGISVTGEVSLADRTTFNYEMLVGRDMLDDANIAVHPDLDYTAPARC